MPGVLFSSRKVTAGDPGIEDMAPTILALFGVAVPAHMTGKTLAVDTGPGVDPGVGPGVDKGAA